MRHIPEEEVIRAANSVPAPVKEMVYSPDTVSIVVAIGKAQDLHVDAIGTLAELNRNMLLGFTNPAEVQQELIAIGIPGERAKAILVALNEQIFKPLNQKMREGRGEPPRVPDPPQVGVPKPLGESLPTPPPAPEPPPVMDATPVVPAVPPQTPNTTPSPIEPLPVFRPSAPPMPVPQPMRPATMPGQAQAAPKSYASDPYREPIDPADK